VTSSSVASVNLPVQAEPGGEFRYSDHQGVPGKPTVDAVILVRQEVADSTDCGPVHLWVLDPEFLGHLADEVDAPGPEDRLEIGEQCGLIEQSCPWTEAHQEILSTFGRRSADRQTPLAAWLRPRSAARQDIWGIVSDGTAPRHAQPRPWWPWPRALTSGRHWKWTSGEPPTRRQGAIGHNMPARRPGTRWPPPIECTVSRVNGSADPAGGAVESALLRVSRAGKPAGGMATCRDPTAGVSKPAGTTRTPPASCHCPARRTQTPSGCGSEEPTSVMSPR